MSAADLAVVVVTLVGIAALVALLLAVQALVRSARELAHASAQLQAETLPLVTELRATVAAAGHEVARVDSLLEAAESIQRTVDGASRLTFVAFSNPLIKVVAFFRGLGRGVGRVAGTDGRRRRRVEARRAARDGSAPAGREAA